jgi:HPt (histidine-containing phosphotransfer) domain-containing protein
MDITATPLLDEDFLNQLREDIGTDSVQEVLHVFLTEAAMRGAAIRRAMDESALSTLRREAHALAGAARNLGMTRLGEAAYALQKECERSGPSAASVNALETMVNETLTLASSWLRDHEQVAT